MRSGEYKHRFVFRRSTSGELMTIVKCFARFVVLQALCRQKGNNAAKRYYFQYPKERFWNMTSGHSVTIERKRLGGEVIRTAGMTRSPFALALIRLAVMRIRFQTALPLRSTFLYVK